ncbi:cytochrome P450 [Streptomyces sp. RS10V-4]|uniref:cytochrome P450 n=1 Tax=Streptomyces rhizoryzae TaxID=2932493 RepID=UPI0020061184|nr:cytochrome P450 [Streptomyces rhizoryzae]MCK7626019.1 cytochrome P450 [Streptomyces rhizoryzae]
MSTETLLERINDYAHRADPYPLYAELREHGVARQNDGSFLVGTYHEVAALLHDPRISSDVRHRTDPDEVRARSDGLPPSFIAVDDPEHDRLRRLAMRPFGPPHSPGRIDALHGALVGIAGELIDGFRGRDRIDLVDDFAYPLPVTVICRLLGVPREDMPALRAWTDTVIASLDRSPGEETWERQQAGTAARTEMAEYLGELADRRRADPADDMISALVHDAGPEGPLARWELMTTLTLLMIAGHETTVNLITNGMLTLLRQPDALERLRREPELMPSAVEELLRYEPPVQMLPQRTPLTDIEVGGVTVPRGAPLYLMLASANRDPLRFEDPDRFDPARRDNEHFGFGSGVHSCFGAPLARLEAQVALAALLRRLEGPRLVADPPPYRHSPILRGPRHLLIDCTTKDDGAPGES